MCPTGTTPHRHSITLRSAFHVIDSDHDGKISRTDLHKFYTSNDVITPASDDVIGSMITAADLNKDGYVEYEEFAKVLEEKESKREREMRRERDSVMHEVFKAMDRDGDGIVGREDLKGFLERAGLRACDEDVKAMIRLGCVGGDENEGVSFDCFLKILDL